MSLKKLLLSVAAILSFSGVAFPQAKINEAQEIFSPITDSIAAYMRPAAAIHVKLSLDSATVSGDRLQLFYDRALGDYSFRDQSVAGLYAIADALMPAPYRGKEVTILSNGMPVERLASRFFSQEPLSGAQKARKKKSRQGPVLVQNLSRPYDIPDGLQGRHLALWQSHGLYYEQSLQRWEWQRARILETVEDLYTQSYVLPFLVPMLENAGANVLLPRERDFNTVEVIVDNDVLMGGYKEVSGTRSWSKGGDAGFANPKPSYLYGENPFHMGTYRMVPGVSARNRKAVPSTARWIANVPKTGEFAVYVSYKTLPNSTSAARYTVRHNGGQTDFAVDQRMGGSTWIYLGTFPFAEHSAEQGVYLTNLTEKDGAVVTADAVKFGGGMGNMARKPSQETPFDVEPETSGYPRFTEGARYWLQWAGYADSVYSTTGNANDYTDDYVSRAKWVNAISAGSRVNPSAKGYNIPVDLSFAFHSDAGTFKDDSIVGTLAIYTRFSNGSDRYADGRDRMAGRQLADLVQTQIVQDVRTQFEPRWSRRGLWDRSYAESRIPEVPAMLLELLSHQNFADMKYGLDPSFRFAVSRAVYKGMLKYLSLENGRQYTVQPLPVKNFAAVLDKENRVRLSWSPVSDPLEPTAVPSGYVIYTKMNDGGFDNGIVVKDSSAVLPVAPDCIYSFKVAAINDGGASFPSEVLSVGISSSCVREKLALIVNNFSRVSGPARFAKDDSTFAGFNNAVDNGVPYHYDISFIGAQHEFRREIPWMDDDAPGFGASYATYEDKVFAGNTFDYPYLHGIALMKSGYSFVSASAGAVENGTVALTDYPLVDMLMGKQSTTRIGRGTSGLKYKVFTDGLQRAMTDFCAKGGNLIVSGAKIATDLWDSESTDGQGKKFAQEVLKYKWMTDYASTDGKVKSAQSPYGFKGKYEFYNTLNDKMYAVESPDALVPSCSDSYTVFRYSDNNISAGVAYKGDYGVVSLGFPIETLKGQDQIDALMAEIIRFFETK